MIKIKSTVILFVIAFFIWCLLTYTLEPASLITGLFVALLVAVSSSHFFDTRPHRWFQFRRYVYFVQYLYVFLTRCIRANIDVAMKVMQPNMPINPGIVKVKTRLKSEVALTFLANSITLTPGTFTVDIDSEEGYLYVHWINVEEKDVQKATDVIVKELEDIIEKVLE